jgi:hypothetical protein
MIEFKQGQDPYKTMEVGSYRPTEVGDEYILIHDLGYIVTRENIEKWIINPNIHVHLFFQKGSSVFIKQTFDEGIQFKGLGLTVTMLITEFSKHFKLT